MGIGGSKPYAPLNCNAGHYVPSHGQVCRAPPNADLASTFLTVGLDYRNITTECSRNGGEFQARIEYHGRDGQSRSAQTGPKNIPNDWREMIRL
ncbi:hypothetical protein PG996_006490 [Apiospora saccharicola]|uniref:Uncharacterized protein n=1 Tax=Apiospora saccharicola TaxID=335842 RepID=A0ABR1VPK8_9PEZI